MYMLFFVCAVVYPGFASYARGYPGPAFGPAGFGGYTFAGKTGLTLPEISSIKQREREFVCVCERERDRQIERQTDRQTDRDRDRET